VKCKTAKPRDIHDLLKLHIEALGRLSDLIEICTKKRDAGKLNVAQQTFVRAQRVLDEIRELE
jgi:hypothetical protein